MTPREVAYIARSIDRRTLRFTTSGDQAREHAWSTHWLSPDLSTARSERLVERASRPPELVVISARHEFTCETCGGSGSFLIMEEGGARCLACAGLDHLAYLPRGNAALSRRAKALSSQSAVVVRFSTARRRYERQGILVEQEALDAAEEQTLSPFEVQERRRMRDPSAEKPRRTTVVRHLTEADRHRH